MKNQHKNMGNHSNGFHEHERHTIIYDWGICPLSQKRLEKLVFSHYFIVLPQIKKGKENTMGQNTLSDREMQAQRLKI